MSRKTKSYLKNLSVGLAIGLAVYFANSQGLENLYGRLCDSCFVPGVLLVCYGGLVFCRNRGAFDTLSYGVSSVFRNHVPGASIGDARQEDFTTWRDRKSAKRKSPAGSLLAGITFLVPAVIFLILYL